MSLSLLGNKQQHTVVLESIHTCSLYFTGFHHFLKSAAEKSMKLLPPCFTVGIALVR